MNGKVRHTKRVWVEAVDELRLRSGALPTSEGNPCGCDVHKIVWFNHDPPFAEEISIYWRSVRSQEGGLNFLLEASQDWCGRFT